MVGYARVSTEDQSLEMQTAALLKAGVLPDNIHVDKKSGVVEKRPGLRHALMDLRTGDTLVVWKLDRLSREPRHVYDLLAQLKNKGCKILSLTEGFDSSTAVGQFFIGVSVAFAAFERALIAERTTAGIAAIREKRGRGEKWGWGRKSILSEKQIKQAGDMLNRKDKPMSGPKVAAHFKVSTPTIYQHYALNRTGRGLRFIRKTKPK
jgi:DNA invertase Pin-like site-specific DNA recombinase